MHELSIAVSILEIVEAEVGSRCGGAPRGRVPSVSVRVGSLSGVDPDALSFAWEATRASGPFPEAELSIERVPARARCRRCDSVFLVEEGIGECLSCGPAAEFDLIEGRELEVRRILWEDGGG